MTPIDDLHTLKTLDPATTPADPHGPRAQADLRRILATNPAPLVQPHRHRRLARRIVLGSGIAAVAATAAVILPSATGGDQAFATWTASPTAMSGPDKAKAAAACRDNQTSGSPDYRNELSSATTAIAERRGDWTLVTLAGPGGFSALCITDQRPALFQTYFGSIGATAPADRPGRRELTATDLGTGTADRRHLSIAAGLAGTDVTRVRYASPSHGDVTATVSGGHFALWLPGDELESASQHGLPVHVTYHDGTTATITLTL
jgi:hypothetical protein